MCSKIYNSFLSSFWINQEICESTGLYRTELFLVTRRNVRLLYRISDDEWIQIITPFHIACQSYLMSPHNCSVYEKLFICIRALLKLMLLGSYAKLKERTISFVISVCPSVRPHSTTRFPLDGFARN